MQAQRELLTIVYLLGVLKIIILQQMAAMQDYGLEQLQLLLERGKIIDKLLLFHLDIREMAFL
jgi:hypothetical protein